MKNKQKGFSTLLGLLLIISLSGGGLYLYSKNVSKEILEEEVLDGNIKEDQGDDNVNNTKKEPNVSITAKNISAGMNSTNNKYAFDINWNSSERLDAFFVIYCPNSSGKEKINIKEGEKEILLTCLNNTPNYYGPISMIPRSMDLINNVSFGDLQISKMDSPLVSVNVSLMYRKAGSNDYFMRKEVLIENLGTTIDNDTDIDPKMIILSPNGGEKISYGSIAMAGDLSFTWKTNQNNYTPSESFKAYIVDEKNNVIRDDGISTRSIDIGNGVYMNSFVGESKIKTNTKYKIKICDIVKGMILVCDVSDGFFVVE